MSSTVFIPTQTTCNELYQSVLKQAAEGVRFTVKEGDTVVNELNQCRIDNFLTELQVENAIKAIIRDDTSPGR